MILEFLIPCSKDFIKGNDAYDFRWKVIRRRNEQQLAVIYKCKPKMLGQNLLPCIVTLTRIAPREMGDDNYIHSMKYIRDQLGDLLIPGLAKGRADDDKRIQWKYVQEKGQPKSYAIKITIETTDQN